MFQIIFLGICGFCAGHSASNGKWFICGLNVLACVCNGIYLAGKLGLIK